MFRKKLLLFVVLLILGILLFSVPVSAHRLTTWANHYNVNNSNTTYSFAFNNSAHINGNNVRYAWQNTTAKK